MLRGDRERVIDVVDGEGDAVHPDLIGECWLRLDRVGVDVLEELELAVAVWCLQNGDPGVVAVQADSSVGPLTADRVTADDRQAEVGEEGDRFFDVANGDADVLQLDGHGLMLGLREVETPPVRRGLGDFHPSVDGSSIEPTQELTKS